MGPPARITVITPGGTATSTSNFTFIPAPTITSFTPSSGGAGAISDDHRDQLQRRHGGNHSAAWQPSFTADSATSITVTVGIGATGPIAVTTPGGTATSAHLFHLHPGADHHLVLPEQRGAGTVGDHYRDQLDQRHVR